MKHRALGSLRLLALSGVLVTACSDSLTQADVLSPAAPVDITTISADAAINDAARISFAPTSADSVRAQYT